MLTHFPKSDQVFPALQMFIQLIVMKCLLKGLTINTILKHIEPNRKKTFDEAVLETCRKSLNFFLYHVFRSKNPCLPRAVLLYRQARMMRMPVKIVFGIKTDGDALKGHAWLELEGKAFLETDEHPDAYTRMFIHPS